MSDANSRKLKLMLNEVAVDNQDPTKVKFSMVILDGDISGNNIPQQLLFCGTDCAYQPCKYNRGYTGGIRQNVGRRKTAAYVPSYR